ncbi:MAG: trypsin-like peptidase domain-containing protein [Acidimicrobiales bacterium]|nr:trypsin-like peptidase domain-containing protein [Acidimicrobiales bacterium]
MTQTTGGPTDHSTRAALDSLGGSTRPTPSPLPTTRRGMLRYRVLPRSVLGISMLVLAFAIGAGFSGVVLYSYYQYKQNQADTKINALVNGYKSQFAKAQADLNAAVAGAKTNISDQVKAAQQLQAGPAQLATLVKQMAPSVFFVHTQDANGQPSVGAAFVVSSNGSDSLLITSYTTVAAATRSPGPNVYVRQGNTDTQVTVRSWDPPYDLALLILPKGGLPALTAAPTNPAPQPGDRLFAVSGLGSAGASLAQGTVVDVSGNGLALDDAVSPAFQGGPVVNQAGQVVGVASRSYAPLGFPNDGIWYSPYVQAACNKVLTCPGGTLVGSH